MCKSLRVYAELLDLFRQVVATLVNKGASKKQVYLPAVSWMLAQRMVNNVNNVLAGVRMRVRLWKISVRMLSPSVV